jgi:hypothetical protein
MDFKNCKDFLPLIQMARNFNKNQVLKDCNGEQYGFCGNDSSSPYMKTTARMGKLVCGCERQPDSEAHLQCKAIRFAEICRDLDYSPVDNENHPLKEHLSEYECF